MSNTLSKHETTNHSSIIIKKKQYNQSDSNNISQTRNVSIGKTLVSRTENVIELDTNLQKTCINELYLTGTCCLHNKMFVTSLDKKISGYKNQDIKKNIHDCKTLITREELLEKLVISKLKCYYCSLPVKILYKMARDPLQWSLDRLDNDKNHTSVNTVISCLDCNLKRRRRDSDKFHFSKNLPISKLG